MPQDSNSFILQLYARTPAPCRDYCGLTIAKDEVVLNIWNITYGPHVYPKRQRRSLEDFLQDKYFQSEIHRLFGKHVLEYVMSIARNERNLQNLSEKLFLQILKYLATKDILNLSQTSKIMFELCNTDNVWKLLFRKYFKHPLSHENLLMADRFGWKDTLLQKIEIKGSKNNKSVAKQPTVKSKTNLKQKELRSNTKNNINSTDNKKVLQKNVAANNNLLITKKVLPSKFGSTTNLINKKNELGNSAENKTNSNPQRIEKSQIVGKTTNIKSRIDSTKSSSTLVTPKIPLLNNVKINQTKSVANLNNPARNALQKTKNCLKFNTKSTNADIKIDIPKMLEQSAACNTNLLANSKLKMQSVATKPNLGAVKNKTSLLKK